MAERPPQTRRGAPSKPAQPAKPTGKPSARAGQTGKPGATHEQVDRRHRFEQARRDSLRPPDDVTVLYGLHTVAAALRNPARRVRRLLATDNAARRLAEEGVSAQPEIVRPSAIAERLPAETVHQGIYLEADALPAPAIGEIEARGVVLVLDQVTDPHNVGAILRSAAAFGVTALITTERHSPDVTGALAKAASGALELVPYVTVQNLARALGELRERGFLLVGLDAEGTADFSDTPLRAPLALVLGAEGRGLRQLTRETCDSLARLDLPGAIKSLNVSNAAALSLYVATRRLAQA